MVKFFDKKTGKTFSGAGVLLFEDNYFKKGPALILVYEKNYKKITEFGGKIENRHLNEKYPIEECASEETFQESCGLIHISVDTLRKSNFIDIPANSTFYRVYLVCVKTGQILSKDFDKNYKFLIKNKNRINFPIETSLIARFLLKDVLNSRFIDAKNHISYPIFPRTSRVLRYYFAGNYNTKPLRGKKKTNQITTIFF